jgi:hypothetical protein
MNRPRLTDRAFRIKWRACDTRSLKSYYKVLARSIFAELLFLPTQVQCNVFNETDDLAITAGGGRRGLPLLANVSEEVAMVSARVVGCVDFAGNTWKSSELRFAACCPRCLLPLVSKTIGDLHALMCNIFDTHCSTSLP